MDKVIRYDTTRLVSGSEALEMYLNPPKDKKVPGARSLMGHMAKLDEKWRSMEGRKPVDQLTEKEKMLEGRIPWDPVRLKELVHGVQ